MLAAKYRDDFLLDFENNTFCNHGSYGAIPKVVMDKKLALIAEMERHPDTWFRSKALPMYNDACAHAAAFVNSKVDNVVLVRNTTQGINTVINCFPKLKKILVNSHTYNAMKNTADLHSTRWGCEVVRVEIPMPIKSEDEIVELFAAKMDEEKDIDFAIIDHISSASALVFPIGRLISECKKRNIIVCIDGAHAPGQIDLHLDDLGADFYVGNLHKWAYVPRGVAVLWSHPKHHPILEPLTTSHLYKGTLHEKFYQQGTDDLTNYFSAATGLEYHKSIGGFDALYNHAAEHFDYVEQRLVNELGCMKYQIPDSMAAPFMKIVKLPKSTRHPIATDAHAKEIFMSLIRDHKVVSKVSCYNAAMYLRVSCNCYNSRQDFDKLTAVIETVIQDL